MHVPAAIQPRAAMAFFREWALIIGMVAGALAYFIVDDAPWFDSMRPAAHALVDYGQPALIFAMLFLSFCRIDPKALSPRRWHWPLLAMQCGLYLAMAVPLMFFHDFPGRVLVEGAMICIMCPTATAAPVITSRLGGDMEGLVSYTVLINLAAALLVPLTVPLVHPQAGVGFVSAASLILAKVFPLLLCPLLLAIVLRTVAPAFVDMLGRHSDLSFWLWVVSLTLAISVTAHVVVTTGAGAATHIGLLLITFAFCFGQFAAGRRAGRRLTGDATTAGQAMGQKNTVLAIWMGLTFFSPVTAVAGGFYSIAHNIVNTRQLRRHARQASS